METREGFRQTDTFVIGACPRCGKGTLQRTRGRVTCLNCGHDRYVDEDDLYSLGELPPPRELPPIRRPPAKKR